jgi:hypothetical protein
MTPRPVPWDFADYRDYLRSMVDHLRATQRHFSFGLVSKRAGFSSRNYLSLVIEGRRRLSDVSSKRFARALKLSSAEQDAFETLVALSRAETEEEKERYKQRLMRPPLDALLLEKFEPMELSTEQLESLLRVLKDRAKAFVAECADTPGRSLVSLGVFDLGLTQ